MGGYSSEYQISLKSGNVVYNTLDKEKYNAYRIHIFKNKWVYVDANDAEFAIDKNDFSVLHITSRVNLAKSQCLPSKYSLSNSPAASRTPASPEMLQTGLVRTYVLHAPGANMTAADTNSFK